MKIRVNLAILLLFAACAFLNAQNEWTGGAGTNEWDNPSNWSDHAVPTASTDVVIPAGKAVYPEAAEDGSSVCRRLYVAHGARVANQHKIDCGNVFVDVTVPANCYNRIVFPMRETFAGDLFTKEQGGAWSGPFEEALYDGVEGTSGPNRLYPGSTYPSLFANAGESMDDKNNLIVRTPTTSWNKPFNAMKYKFSEGHSVDIWMDNGKDASNHDLVTFRFPAAVTVPDGSGGGITQYPIYDQYGYEIDGEYESITRTAERNKLIFCASTVTRKTGFYEPYFAPNHTAMFAAGNPTLALMNIKLFLKENVTDAYTTPFIYLFNNDAVSNHGTETILYYNAATTKLYQVNASAADTEVPAHGESVLTEINDNNDLGYVQPLQGFRLMSGASKVTVAEPALIGDFSSDGGAAGGNRYGYYGVLVGTQPDGSDATVCYGKKSDESGKQFNSMALTITATDDPNVVRLGGFCRRGYTYAHLDIDNNTLTIPNGAPVHWAGAAGQWKMGPTGVTNPAKRIFRVYGCTDAEPVWGDWFLYRKTYYARKVTNLGADIVLDYIVDQEAGTASIRLRNPFVMYSEEFLNDNTKMLSGSSPTAEAEAIWVYGTFETFKSNNENSGGSNFILPEALGKYKATISAVTREQSGACPVDALSVGYSINTITIDRTPGIYDYVLVDGIFPGKTGFPVTGQITEANDSVFWVDQLLMGSTKADYHFSSNGKDTTMSLPKAVNVYTWHGKATHKLSIIGGQLVFEASATDVSRNYCLYNTTTAQPVNMYWVPGAMVRYNEVYDLQYKCDYDVATGKWKTPYISAKTYRTRGADLATIANANQWVAPHRLQVSYLNSVLSRERDMSGFMIGTVVTGGTYNFTEVNGRHLTSATLTRTGDLDDSAESGGEESGESGESETEETINMGNPEAAHRVAFHTSMFRANKADFADALADLAASAAVSPAPKRRGVPQAQDNGGMFQVFAEAVSGKYANTMVVYNEDAEAKFNRFEDAPLFDVKAAKFIMATITSGANVLVGVNQTNSLTNIPLYLSESATLTFAGIDQLGEDLVLYDAVNEQVFDLTSSSEIFAEIGANQKAGRWFIRTKDNAPAVTTGVGELNADKDDWRPFAWNPQAGTLVVRSGAEQTTAISLYNIAGQCVARRTADDMATFRNLSAGTYVLQVVAAGRTKQIKVLVK